MRGKGDLTRLVTKIPSRTLTLSWNDGDRDRDRASEITFTYDRGGSFLGEGSKFLYVHGEEGDTQGIFRIDDQLRHIKLEDEADEWREGKSAA